MNDILKYGLIGAGVYFALPYLTGGSTPAAAATTTAPAAASAAPAAAPASLTAMQQSVYPVVTQLGSQGPGMLLQMVQAQGQAATVATTMTFQQWNYFLSHLTGVNGPDTNTISGFISPGSAFTVGQYWTALTNWATGKQPTYPAGAISGLGVANASVPQEQAPRFDYLPELSW